MPKSMQIIPIRQYVFQYSRDFRFESVTPILLAQDASIPTWHHPPELRACLTKCLDVYANSNVQGFS